MYCLPYGITAVRGYETLRLEKQGVHLKKNGKGKAAKKFQFRLPAGWEEEKKSRICRKSSHDCEKTSVFPERIEEKSIRNALTVIK